MFGTQFYPTPPPLVSRMLAGVDFRTIGTVLEPSAGSGVLVEAVASRMSSYNRYGDADIDAIELDPELAAMLTGKGHRLVWDDFLTYRTWKRYDLIVMNPPFAAGAKHLIKALDMQAAYGGTVVCLLNAETLRNPHTTQRQHLVDTLTYLEARIEYVNGAFTNAARPTDVEVAIVTAVTPPPDRADYVGSEFRTATDHPDTDQAAPSRDQLAVGDVIAAMIADFDNEAALGVDIIEQFNAAKTRLTTGRGIYAKPLLDLHNTGHDHDPATVNRFLRDLRHKYWRALFDHPVLTSKLTIAMNEALRHRLDEFAGYDFNAFNVRTLQLDLAEGLNRGIEDAAVKVFDTLSQKHAMNEFSRNRHLYDGWKTNDAWQINRRVIIPIYLGYFASAGSAADALADIEKVLNYFDGMAPIEQRATDVLARYREIRFGQKVACHYFDATVYAKGTIHITFRCPDLVKQLNVFAGKRYNMLPPDYGRKAYADLNADERRIVDAFEGEAEYARTRQALATCAGPRLALTAAG